MTVDKPDTLEIYTDKDEDRNIIKAWIKNDDGEWVEISEMGEHTE